MVTLVIPIWNGERYCNELFHSIAAQKGAAFETVLINDGSTDKTREICTEYCEKDSRFTLINQEKRGLPAARNRGIERAAGEYIWFVDADDQLMEDSVFRVSKHIQQLPEPPDILFSNAEMFSDRGVYDEGYFYLYDVERIRRCDADSLMCYFWSDFDLAWSVWRHWFRTDFLRDNSLYFDEDQVVYEASGWLIRAIMAAKSYDAFQPNIYRYRIDNDESIMHRRFSLELFLYASRITVKWFRFFQKEYQGTGAAAVMMKKLSREYRYLTGQISLLSGLERRRAFETLEVNMDVLRYGKEG